jgi:hypothetical protein
MFNYDTDLLKEVSSLEPVADDPSTDTDTEVKILDDLSMHSGIFLAMESDNGLPSGTAHGSTVLWGAACGQMPIPGDIAAKALASFDGIFYADSPEGKQAHIYLVHESVINRIVVELLEPIKDMTYHLYIFNAICPRDLGKLMLSVKSCKSKVVTYLNMVGPSPWDAMAFLLWACGDVLMAPSFGGVCLVEPFSIMVGHSFSSFKAVNNQAIANQVKNQWFGYLVDRGLLSRDEVQRLFTKNAAIFIDNDTLRERVVTANATTK